MRGFCSVDRRCSSVPVVFLISVLGVLFAWPLRAQPEAGRPASPEGFAPTSAPVKAAAESAMEPHALIRAADNRIFVRADIQIGQDGSVEGQSLTEATGPSAFLLSELVQKLESGRSGMDLARLLQRQSLEGEARLGPRDQRGDMLGQHLAFRLRSQSADDPVLRVSTMPGPRLFRPPFADLITVLQDSNVAFSPCRAVLLEHQIILHLPDKRLLVDTPQDITVLVPAGSYQVRYEVEKTRIIVRRRLEFEPGTAICRREQVLEMAPLIRAVSRDLARPLYLRLPTG